MTLISIIGDVGSGKTLLATYLASKEKRKVYSNYTIKIPGHVKMNPEMLISINEPSLVIIDEAYTWLESRLSGRNLNLYLSYILFQSRKRELDIMLTDQLVGTVDLRFRQMTNYEIHCEAIPEGFAYRIFKISRYHNYKPKTVKMHYSTAEKVFPIYDSWEFINPIDGEMLFKVSEDKGSIIDDIDKITMRLLDKAPASAYTKGIIDDYCLRNNYPKSYVNLIYNSIKASAIGG